MNLCSIDGCEKRAKAHGWCGGHYQRWLNGDDPAIAGPLRKMSKPLVPRMKKEGKSCSVDGCDRKGINRGWCQTHYMRWWESGDVRADIPIGKMRKQKPVCSVEGCDRPHCVHGLCQPHHDKLRRRGSLVAPDERFLWSPREDDLLRKYGSRGTWAQTAAILPTVRTVYAVQMRGWELKIRAGHVSGLSIKEVAERLSVSDSCVRWWIALKLLSAGKSGKYVFVNEWSVEAFERDYLPFRSNRGYINWRKARQAGRKGQDYGSGQSTDNLTSQGRGSCR